MFKSSVIAYMAIVLYEKSFYANKFCFFWFMPTLTEGSELFLLFFKFFGNFCHVLVVFTFKGQQKHFEGLKMG